MVFPANIKVFMVTCQSCDWQKSVVLKGLGGPIGSVPSDTIDFLCRKFGQKTFSEWKVCYRWRKCSECGSAVKIKQLPVNF